jgi:hypothetical protein
MVEWISGIGFLAGSGDSPPVGAEWEWVGFQCLNEKKEAPLSFR